MILSNFLYFIVAILFFSAAPMAPTGVFTPAQNLMVVVVILLGFWHFNRYKFTQLRIRLNNEEISLEAAKKEYFTHINIHFIIAIILFAFEIFAFDLKYLVLQTAIPGFFEFFGNAGGLVVFILHLSIVWYWGFRTMGDVLEIGDSPGNYIRSNIKFNLFIVIPWLIFSIIIDLLRLFFPGSEIILSTPILREVIFCLFLVVLAIFAPVFIARMWDCKPLPPSELKDNILVFCRSQGVKFKDIVSWNALGKSLVTAGVMGLVSPFRYLMITPTLMNLLNEDEIMAVVSHEVGHVKRRHLLLYLVFLMGFIIFGGYIMELIEDFFLTTSTGLGLITTSRGEVDLGMAQVFFLPLLILVFIVYFRFVFGYFMRIFERQADGYCFKAGLDPNHMISSFMKLKVRLGENSNKTNWHHYNLSQRIDFMRKGIDHPETITRHDKKVKRSVITFITVLILFTAVFFSTYTGQSNLKRLAAAIEIRLDKTPDDHRLYAVLGEIYFQLKEWKASEKAYKYAIGLNYNQPNVLNNLAWLLLTSEDESLRDPERALKLARDAASKEKAAHIMDTLAEAYYQNQMYWEAFQAAKQALQLSIDNRSYFNEQLEKMKKALKPGE
jgi:Zn-dependent protease with chaperone function